MFPDSSWAVLAAAGAIGLAGGLSRGISGFGATLIMVPLLAHIVPTQQAVATVAVTTLVTNIPMCIALRREAHWRAIAVICIGAFAGLPLGLWVLTHLSSDALRRVAGAVVLVSALSLALARRRKADLGLPYQLGAGFAGGVLNGAVGLGGPPVVLYFLWTAATAQMSRASFIAYFTVLQLVQVSALIPLGLVTAAALGWTALVAPAMLLGSYLGSLAFRAGGHRYFRAIALALLGGTGLAALLR
jgi:uncharacterized membrane protein YfcA